MDVPDVVVVGAGIVGASVAYHLARVGARVVLIDKALPATGVTGDSFAWIGGPGGADRPDASSPLRRSALADHRRLEGELQVPVRWTGSLLWDEDSVAEGRTLAPHERVIDAAEVARLEPRLREPPARALHTTTDGAVDPVVLTSALGRAAVEHGAELAVGVGVTRLRREGPAVVGVDTSRGFIAAETVVLAAGVEVPLLCAPLGVNLPVVPSPAVLLRFAAEAGLVRTLVKSPEIEVRQASDDVLLATAEYSGEVGPEDLMRTGEQTVARIRRLFRDADDVRLLGVRVGMRPMPADGLPIIGPLPGVDGVYVAVMHAGVTLAPAVGRLVAQEIVGGEDADELRGLRPVRFA